MLRLRYSATAATPILRNTVFLRATTNPSRLFSSSSSSESNGANNEQSTTPSSTPATTAAPRQGGGGGSRRMTQYSPVTEYVPYAQAIKTATDQARGKIEAGYTAVKRVDEHNEARFQISSKKFVTVKIWNNTLLVSIREYYEPEDGSGALLPSKTGIALTLEQWELVKHLIPAVDAELAKN